MYLILGEDRDSCAHAVRAALQRRGRAVLTTVNPFDSAGTLRWAFDSRSSRLVHAFDGRSSGREGALEGVLVRNYSALLDPSGWTVEDAAYLHNEGMAAVLAWLHALECPVVGRPTDDAWYRPQRPLPEWVGLLASCGLPTPSVIVTNAPEAERLVAAWPGPVVYQPLTSARTYEIDGGAWSELAKVMAHVPVCLTEQLNGPRGAVTVIGDRLFWTHPPERERSRLELAVRRVADRLDSDFVQVLLQVTVDGPRFTTVNLQPTLEVHEPTDRDAVVDEISRRLLGSDATSVAPSQSRGGELHP